MSFYSFLANGWFGGSGAVVKTDHINIWGMTKSCTIHSSSVCCVNMHHTECFPKQRMKESSSECLGGCSLWEDSTEYRAAAGTGAIVTLNRLRERTRASNYRGSFKREKTATLTNFIPKAVNSPENKALPSKLTIWEIFPANSCLCRTTLSYQLGTENYD